MRVEDNGGAGDDLIRRDPALTAIAAAIQALLPTALVGDRFKVDTGAAVGASFGNPTNLAVVGGTALTASTGTFIEIPTLTRFRLQVNNIGAANLNGFEISTRCNASADMQIHLNTGAHFTAPPSDSILRLSGDTLGASVDPTTLNATTGKVILAFDFRDFFVQTIRIRASAASNTTLQFYWGGL
jgi:hypothetical protein